MVVMIIFSTVLHSIESQNSVKRSSNTLDASPSGSSTQSIGMEERRGVLDHDTTASAAEVEARIAKKVALLDQPVREFTTKPGNSQVNIFIFLLFVSLSYVLIDTGLFSVGKPILQRFVSMIWYAWES